MLYDEKRKSDGEKIKNKELLLYSAQKAVGMVSLASAECAEHEEVYFAIGTAIHWIADCIDRIPESIVKTEDKKLFSAIRCVNNCLKHNVNFREAHKTDIDFPFDFPFDFGAKYIWTDINGVEIKMTGQKNNYDKELNGKNVHETLLEALELINKYYSKI